MKISGNKGMIFITISIVLTMTFLIISTLMHSLATETKTGNAYLVGNKAYFIAKSAESFAIDYIRNNRSVFVGYKETKTNTDNIFAVSEYHENHQMIWEVTQNDENINYTIQLVGVYGNQTRNIRVKIEFDESNLAIIREFRLITV